MVGTHEWASILQYLSPRLFLLGVGSTCFVFILLFLFCYGLLFMFPVKTDFSSSEALVSL